MGDLETFKKKKEKKKKKRYMADDSDLRRIYASTSTTESIK